MEKTLAHVLVTGDEEGPKPRVNTGSLWGLAGRALPKVRLLRDVQ